MQSLLSSPLLYLAPILVCSVLFCPNLSNLSDPILSFSPSFSSCHIKISTLFLEHLFPLFKLFKKDIIKFAWNHIKADDSATRFWAYINICRFVASFDSPPKIIIQVMNSITVRLTFRLFDFTVLHAIRTISQPYPSPSLISYLPISLPGLTPTHPSLTPVL
jgi:hypothetical protein